MKMAHQNHASVVLNDGYVEPHVASLIHFTTSSSFINLLGPVLTLLRYSLYILGGDNGQQHLDIVERFDTNTGKMYNVTSMRDRRRLFAGIVSRHVATMACANILDCSNKRRRLYYVRDWRRFRKHCWSTGMSDIEPITAC